MDLAEGILLSLTAQDKETQGNVSAINNNANGMITGANFTDQRDSSGIITRLSYLSIDRLQRALAAVPEDPTTRLALADSYQTLAVASSKQGNAREADESFKLFRSFFSSETTVCSKTGVSHKCKAYFHKNVTDRESNFLFHILHI